MNAQTFTNSAFSPGVTERRSSPSPCTPSLPYPSTSTYPYASVDPSYPSYASRNAPVNVSQSSLLPSQSNPHSIRVDVCVLNRSSIATTTTTKTTTMATTREQTHVGFTPTRPPYPPSSSSSERNEMKRNSSSIKHSFHSIRHHARAQITHQTNKQKRTSFHTYPSSSSSASPTPRPASRRPLFHSRSNA